MQTTYPNAWVTKINCNLTNCRENLVIAFGAGALSGKIPWPHMNKNYKVVSNNLWNAKEVVQVKRLAFQLDAQVLGHKLILYVLGMIQGTTEWYAKHENSEPEW